LQKEIMLPLHSKTVSPYRHGEICPLFKSRFII